MSTTSRGRRFAQRAGFALALCVPASAGGALVLHAVRAAEVPSRADWAAAAAAVRASWQPNDLVTFLPGWAQEGRGDFVGLRALPDEQWGEDTIAGARRLHVVVSFGAALPKWLTASSTIEGRARFGELEVVRVSRAATAPLYDFTSRVGDAVVSLDWVGKPSQPCPKAGARHDCTQGGPASWRYVAEHRLPAGGRARRCVWAHPTENAALRISYPAATLGATLRISHALSDEVAERGAAVTIEVEVDGQRLGAVTREPRRGWNQDTLSTSAFAGKNAAVSFSIKTRNEGSRHFCFAAEALP